MSQVVKAKAVNEPRASKQARTSLNITPPEEGDCFDANNYLQLAKVRNHIYKQFGCELSVLLASKQTYREALSVLYSENTLAFTPPTHFCYFGAHWLCLTVACG